MNIKPDPLGKTEVYSMKRLILLRQSYTSKSVQGVLLTPNDKMYYTLEQPWRNNQIGNSCIPEGDYPAVFHTSPKFGPTYWLQDTQPRSEILIHVGNYPRDTIGCILLGTSKGENVVWNSRQAMSEFLAEMEKIPATIRIIKYLT